MKNPRNTIDSNTVVEKYENSVNEQLPTNRQLFDNQATDLESDELIGARELSKRLNIPEKTIRGWRYKRILPSNSMVKTGPKLVRYRWKVVMRWLQTNGDYRNG